ncbi:MAG: phospholipase D-like domain-containing protein [Verrucomicrobiota bacterium JB023]|nr:phospholipase D-like domain-containing protein [Verrucomicrobiota bacterium JB023]
MIQPIDTSDNPDFPTRDGNHLEMLINGQEIFPRMLQAIRDARHSISLETYVYWAGEIAVEFAESLARAAKRGVIVRVVLDWYGSKKMDRGLIERMDQAGVKVRHFRPLKWYDLKRSNQRTHRKLMVVDGQVGFTGGVGIAEEWTGDAEDPQHWRDNHYQLRGPIVGDMQRLFFAHWEEDDRPEAQDKRFYPTLKPEGNLECRLIAAEPSEGENLIERIYLDMLAKAEERFLAVAPYFAPSETIIAELVKAAKRGVKVEVIAAGENNDMRVVRKAFRHDWGDLLEAGVDIYEYNRTLIHVKMLIVDEKQLLIGSSNFDIRSLRINSEACILIEDKSWIQKHAEVFADDRQLSEKISYEQWKSRPPLMKAKDRLSHTLRDFL